MPRAKAKKGENDTFDDKVLAARLMVSPKTVYRLRRKGVIPFYRIGAFVRYDEECYATILKLLRRNAAA